ncbi:hypothetical protein EO244_00700 [Ancylomarina salipaludis]|uniref:DegT/DnrJ/EryC1/StrS aminotransferase family protein n=1 Tax=Ancylomarina salipaludis TaxID=2501299 RepID=A0A4Q1JR46_9BACT|nr:hypothetical protein [Ancylomarina salipaludis]RXQ97440.1 hypothetical protein EO244_00700 [Ancylomarina salipaludis]
MSTKEIGSNFHTYTFSKETDFITCHENAYYYGCGRCAVNALIKYHLKKKLWKRLFVPEYYCYEVIDSIKSTGIEIVLYPDYPLANDNALIEDIKFREGDVLLRMNYFGLRNFRDNSTIDAIVIEDHSHDLFSDWAYKSNADWCVASLRKTIPIPDGGILWSTKNDISCIEEPISNSDHAKLSEDRCLAMNMKKMYLDSVGNVDKKGFMEIFRRTEMKLGSCKCPALSSVSKEIIKNIPISIVKKKYDNYSRLAKILSLEKCTILKGENHASPFSLVLLFNSMDDRNAIREALIKNKIYSAVLWEIKSEKANHDIISFSQRMLSLPIDFRYSESDIFWMSQIVNNELLKI